ncbi:MAG TPA: dienelactone hydrolase family protein [bacterium]|nr:dienelactone hydrolase family protein [bacterium]
MKKWFLLLASFGMIAPLRAELKTQVVEYKQGGTTLEGYLAYDDAVKGKRPGVLVVHEWNGLGSYAKHRAEQVAKLGYVAFAADIYGKGVRPDTFESCKAESNKYYANRQLLRDRAKAGLDMLRKNEMVDPKKLAAIGYCFGGATVLELGRSGADLRGIVSFHGGLDNPKPADAKNIRAKILVCQGGADQFTLSAVPGFKKEMDDAKVDYKFITYKGAVHGFTNPDNKGTVPGLKYNAKADKASWKAMVEFFNEIFGKG